MKKSITLISLIILTAFSINANEVMSKELILENIKKDLEISMQEMKVNLNNDLSRKQNIGFPIMKILAKKKPVKNIKKV